MAIAFGISSPSWFVYEVGYLTQAPDDYICKFTEDDVPPDTCTKKNICDNDPLIESYKGDPNDDKFLYNWQQ